ncbi:hypothetical protein C8R11_1369, partial [Nitrosomonas aestuarii]
IVLVMALLIGANNIMTNLFQGALIPNSAIQEPGERAEPNPVLDTLEVIR